MDLKEENKNNQDNHKIPGIVVIRNIISLEEQLKLIEIVEKKGGLLNSDEEYNFFNRRGRHFSSLNKYNEDDAKFLKDCCKRFKEQTESIDKTLIWSDVTHMLTLWYPDANGLGWHKDGYGGNDGDIGAPVYSLTIGNSCIFEYKLVDDKNKISVQLNSGDLIVFGGPQRLMYHRVKTVIANSFKEKSDFNARINLTLRTCSDFNEDDEETYQTEKYVQKLVEERKSNFNARINLTLRTCSDFNEDDEEKYQTEKYVQKLVEERKSKLSINSSTV